MTRDDTLPQEPVAWMQDTSAGLYVADRPDQWHTVPLFTADQLREYARQAVLAEREACAKAFEAETLTWTWWHQAGAARRKGAAAIRGRKT